VGQLGQLAVVTLRHVLANLAQRLLGEVEVVQHPLGNAGESLLPGDAFKEHHRGLEKRLLCRQVRQ
jgi:hypothetical protein